jgi:hypothetical protein
MKCELIIITRERDEYGVNLWGFPEVPNQLQIEKYNEHSNSIVLIKQAEGTPIEKNIEIYSSIILDNINTNKEIDQRGIIFHKQNGGAEALNLRSSLEATLNCKLAFCEWYSSNKTAFWDERNFNADLPYNNLKKAWKDNAGDKAITFEKVWCYFLGVPELEALIRLNKSLNLLPLKLNDDWTESAFNAAKATLEITFDTELISSMLKNISFTSNPVEYFKQLESVESEIVNMTTTRR